MARQPMRVQRLPTRTPKGASRRKKREHNKPRSAFLILSVTLEVLLECNVLSGGVHCTTAHFEHETVIRGLPLISLFKRKASGIAPHWSCSLDDCMTWISFPLECGDTDPFSNRFNRLKQGQRLSSRERRDEMYLHVLWDVRKCGDFPPNFVVLACATHTRTYLHSTALV